MMAKKTTFTSEQEIAKGLLQASDSPYAKYVAEKGLSVSDLFRKASRGIPLPKTIAIWSSNNESNWEKSEDIKTFFKQRAKLFEDVMKIYEAETGLPALNGDHFSQGLVDTFEKYREFEEKSKIQREEKQVNKIDLKTVIKSAIEANMFNKWLKIYAKQNPQSEQLISWHSEKEVKDKVSLPTRLMVDKIYAFLELSSSKEYAEYRQDPARADIKEQIENSLDELKGKLGRFGDFVGKKDGQEEAGQLLTKVKLAIRGAEKILEGDSPDVSLLEKHLQKLTTLTRHLSEREKAVKLEKDQNISEPPSPQLGASRSDTDDRESISNPADVQSLADEDSSEKLSSSQEKINDGNSVDAEKMVAISADLSQINKILSSHKDKDVGEVKIGKLKDFVSGAKVLYGAKAPHEASQLCLLEVNPNGNVKSARFKIAHRSQLANIRISNETLPGIVLLQESTIKDLPKVLQTALNSMDGNKEEIHPLLTASVQDHGRDRMVPKKGGAVSLDSLPQAQMRSSNGNKRGV